MPTVKHAPRAQWDSQIGFVLAAAGSAVGLGNIWKFPYITGENGGGAFVLVYLACILVVGVPVLIAEILLGRATKASPVNAFRSQSGRRSPWVALGILAVFGSFMLLSYYSTVAGWAMHFTYLSLTGQIAGNDAETVQGMFSSLTSSVSVGLGWQIGFLIVTFAVVAAGVAKGIERWARIMMPSLFVLLLVLLVNSVNLDGWGQGIDFLFGMRFDNLTASGVLEALGHAFFTLSIGMGAMLTYGSYLSARDDLPSAAAVTAGTDTLVALVASMVIFPIVFTFGLEPGSGPSLLFISLPTALAQMAGGTVLSIVFFVALVFAALTSAISMFEVLRAFLVEEFGLSHGRSCVFGGIAIVIAGIPPTVSSEWFGVADYLVSNLCLPLGGLGVAIFVAWKMDRALRQGEFEAGSRLAGFYRTWLWVLKYPVPVGIVIVFLHVVGVV